MTAPDPRAVATRYAREWLHWYAAQDDSADPGEIERHLSYLMMTMIHEAIGAGGLLEGSLTNRDFLVALQDTYMDVTRAGDLTSPWPAGNPDDPDCWHHDWLHLRAANDHSAWLAHFMHAGPAQVHPAIMFLSRGIRRAWRAQVGMP